MMQGFPVSLIDYIQCNKDGGVLEILRTQVTGDSIINGDLKCIKCKTVYKISEGILDMLDSSISMDKHSIYEIRVRDNIASNSANDFYQAHNMVDKMEVSSTIRRLGKTKGKTLLELGCGTGRFTGILAKDCESVLAVDFSMNSLQSCAKIIPSNVGLVRADVSKLKLRPNSFDLALSTLYSNLPSAEIRIASTKAVYEALKPNGRYVLSAHHHEIRERLKGINPVGKYDNGIFYQAFTKQSLRQELGKYFSKINLSTICIWLPYISRFETARVFVSKVSERMPILNNLGALLLATAIKN